MLTCEAVLAEAAYLLARARRLARREDSGRCSSGRFINRFPSRWKPTPALWTHLLEKYHDQGIQLADACLVRMSELKRDCRVFTLDKPGVPNLSALRAASDSAVAPA